MQQFQTILIQFIHKKLMQTRKQDETTNSPSQPIVSSHNNNSPITTTKRALQTIYGSRFSRNSKQLNPLNTSSEKKQSKANKSTDYYTFQRSLVTQKNRPSIQNTQPLTSHYTTTPLAGNPNTTTTDKNGFNTQKTNYAYRKAFSVSKQSAAQIQVQMTQVNNFGVGKSGSKGGIINLSKIVVTNPQNYHNNNVNGVSNPNHYTTARPNAHAASNSHIRSSFSSYKQTSQINSSPIQAPHTPVQKSFMNNTTTGFNRTPQSPSNKPVLSNTLTPSSKPTNANTHAQPLGHKMNQTAQNFRPPTTSSHFRQCNNEAEDHQNYLNKYEIIRELGKGTYGVVHLAKKKKNKWIARPVDLSQSFCFGASKDKDRASVFLSDVEVEDAVKDQDKRREASIEYKRQRCSIQIGRGCDKQQHQQNKANMSLVIQGEQAQTRQTILPPIRCQSPSISMQQKPQQPTPEQPEQPSSSQLCAIKIYQKFKMNKDPTKFKNIRKQITIMQNINHRHIIKLYQSVQTLTKINIVVQYGGKESLLEYLKDHYPLTEHTMRRIGQQLLSAIVYLHEKNIVHRDIKLQNILMLDGDVKIIDFGFSTLTFKNRKLNAICGTPNYMAPEVLSKKEYIGELADVWSFGVVMFTIGQGRHPFKAETYNQLQRLVNKGNYQFKRITNPVHQAFIKRILKTKPQDRPRAIDLVNHAWLQMKDETESINQELKQSRDNNKSIDRDNRGRESMEREKQSRDK